MGRNFYQTEAFGVTSIVIASTPGKARYATFLAMRAAGYRVELCGVRISVRRRRDMDGSMTKAGGIPVEGKCLAPDMFANNTMKGNQ
jgi:L-cystine uptake protein TcyP (sodium:dicarboxylate symporter family)